MIIVRIGARSSNVNFTVYITFLSPSDGLFFFRLFVILLRYIYPSPQDLPEDFFKHLFDNIGNPHYYTTLKSSLSYARSRTVSPLPSPAHREFATAAVRYPPTPRGPRARKHYVNTLGVFYCGRIYV